MKYIFGIVPAAVLALLAIPAAADVVRLHDGSTIEGVVREEGDEVVLEMGDGGCRLPKSSVASIERKPFVAPPSAREIEKPAMTAAKPAAIAPKPTADEIYRLITDSVSADTAKSDAASARLAQIPHGERYYRYVRSLWNPDPQVRQVSTDYLRARNHPAAVPPLLRRVIHEPDDAVRQSMGKTLGVLPDPDYEAPRYLTNALILNTDPETRVRAAEVMGWTGQRRYIEVLVTEYTRIWGRSNRAHIFVGEQRPYIQDYDIQVAAGAFALDPKVGYVQHGVVLDTTVLKIEEKWTEIERKTYHGALVNLAGEDAGLNPADWRRWMEREAARKREAQKEGTPPAPRSP